MEWTTINRRFCDRVTRSLSSNVNLIPNWDELSGAFASLNGLPIKPTLDVVNNPRWGGQNTFYIPSVVDRIYILDNWAEKTLKNVRIFGTDISRENNLSASDHYGVVAEVDFVK